MCQLAPEVWTHDAQDTASADLVDQIIDPTFACLDFLWRPLYTGIERLGGQEYLDFHLK